MEAPVMHKPLRYSPTSAPTMVDLILKISTGLLMSFAAALVLVHAQAYLARWLLLS
jgi:hypothetical protein